MEKAYYFETHPDLNGILIKKLRELGYGRYGSSLETKFKSDVIYIRHGEKSVATSEIEYLNANKHKTDEYEMLNLSEFLKTSPPKLVTMDEIKDRNPRINYPVELECFDGWYKNDMKTIKVLDINGDVYYLLNTGRITRSNILDFDDYLKHYRIKE